MAADIQKLDLVDIDLNSGNISRSWLNHTIGMADNKGNAFGVRVFRDGEAVTLSSVSVQGHFRDPHGTNISITDSSLVSVSGHIAYVILPQACYNYEGQFCLAIKLVGGGVTGTMRIVDGMVSNTNTSNPVTPTTVPTYQEILSLYDDMQDAADVANAAIAPEYSDLDFPVVKGELCIYNGHLYRAKQDISSSETWTSGHWETTTFGTELKNEESARQLGDMVTQNDMAVIYNEALPYDAGKIVIKDGVTYLLPNGHTAGTAWASTTKTIINLSDHFAGEVSDLKSAINVSLNNIIDISDEGWVIGTLKPADASQLESDTRIRSGFIRVNCGGSISLSGNENCLIVYWYSENKTYISASAWTDGNEFIIPAEAYYIRILIRKSSSNETLSSNDIPTQVARCTYKAAIPKAVYDFPELQAEIESIESDIETSNAKIIKLQDDIGYRETLTKNDATYNLRKKTNNQSVTEDSNGTRIRIIFDLGEAHPCAIVAQETSGKGLTVNGYNDLGPAIGAGTPIQSVTGTTFTTDEVTGTTTTCRYITVSLCKADESVITDAEREVLFDNLTLTITVYLGEAKRLDEIETDIQRIYNDVNDIKNEEDIPFDISNDIARGTFNTSTGAEISSTTRIRTGFIPVTDYGGVVAKTDDGYKHTTYWYDSSKAFISGEPYETEWVTTEKTYPVPRNASYIRFLIARNDDADINLSEYSNGHFYGRYKIIYDVEALKTRESGDSYPLGFSDAEAAKKNFASNPRYNNNLNYLPSFLHLSDIHGDAERFERACQFAKDLSADALICTGDMVRYNSTDDFSFVVNAADVLLFVPCIGNHDVWDFTTEQEMYDKYIKPFKDNYSLPSGVLYPTYFYKDISTKSIRIISLNQYQSDSSNANRHDYVLFHQDQITWFANTLLSTPQGYGVVVLMHTPEKTPVADATYTKFKQGTLLYTSPLDYKPITEIVDAFISGAAIQQTYSNGSGRTPETFTVNANFSSKNTGVEFIAYMTGHLHADNIYYVANTINKQLMLNVTCANAWVNKNTNGATGTSYPNYTELSDLPRTTEGQNQDALNFYVIDRVNKAVRVVRIGANRTYDLSTLRDCMTIPYAD